MIKLNLSITIGIPAYNEEKNIGLLLDSILKQKLIGANLKEIIVLSDASTDKTNRIVLKRKNNLIKLITNEKRRGQAYAQNKIIEIAQGDLLIILNADIILKDQLTLFKLIKPILLNQADLVSCKLLGEPRYSKLANLLNFSIKIKNKIYESYKKGLNLYTCHGAVRAFSKNLYQSLRFKESAGEDAYSYLYSKQYGFKYSYVKNAVAYIISPSNIEDHLLQSSRFFYSQKLMYKLFGSDFVKKEYSLPKLLVFNTLSESFFQDPINTLIYILIFILVKVKVFFFPYKYSQTWTISVSSKK